VPIHQEAARPTTQRNLIVERVRAGMRRAKLEGRHIGRRPLQVDRDAVLRERARGHSLTEIAKLHRISRALVSRILKEAGVTGHKGPGAASCLLSDSTASQAAG